MSKTLRAQCSAGIVTVEGTPVPAARVLSSGVGSSEGVLILDEDKADYIAKTVQDLDATLQDVTSALGQVVTALGQIASGLTAIGAGMTGPTTAPPPTLAVTVAAITAASVQITTSQTNLTALKAMLK